MKKIILLLSSTLLLAVSSHATTIVYSSQLSSNFAGVNGAELVTGFDTIEVGTISGTTFTSLFSSTDTESLGAGAGFTAVDTGRLNTASIAGSQLAIKWTDVSEGVFGIAYTTTVSDWSVSSGDGGGTDFFTNNIDIADLTVGQGGIVLTSSAILAGNAVFSGTNSFGATSFSLTPIPEPGTFALLFGFMAFTWVAIRRRK